MARALLAIGCSEYEDATYFPLLPGADTDAERVFGTLVERTGHYDQSMSKKLISPTLAEVRSALKDLYDLKEVDVLSFFFAGHGATEGGIYYLCPKDALGERLPVTALPISEALAVLAHVRPRQVNLVMDSCESGGAMLDMASLLKAENLVGPKSPNVSFLATSAPDQSSYGDPVKGGYATTALMTYLDGDKQLRSDRPFLDLVELGRNVSEDVGDDIQRPVAWGINLYGEDQFAENPFYEATAGRPSLPVALAPSTAAGATVRKYAEPLWRHYQSLPTDPAYRDLAELLRSACKDLEGVGASSATFMRGVASTLRDRAELSDDPLAPSDALASCLIVLLPFIEKEEVAALARELLAEKRELDSAVCKELAEQIRSDRFALLNTGFVLADFFLLPIRVSRVLGWLSAGVLTEHLLDASDDESIRSHTELASLVAKTYRDSLIAVSDEQAPQVYLFAKACQILGEEVLAREVLSAYFASFEDVDGFVAMVQASPQEAFRYLAARMSSQLGSQTGATANPAEFLPALLLPGSHLGLGDVWNPRLRTFDGRIIGFFVPADHKEFGAPRMPAGANRWPRVGHDIWTLQQLTEWFEEAVAPAVSGDPSWRLVETKPLCVLASYLFADRLPYFLED